MDWHKIFASLERFYRDLESTAFQLDKIHRKRLQCRKGCYSCCIDGITIFEVEAKHIQRCHEQLLTKGKPHKKGVCAFLGESGECRIYENRPYVCRTQGYPLRWLDESTFGTIVEKRDICSLNDKGKPIEELPEKECWTIGPFEERLAKLQFLADGGKKTRIILRDLFKIKNQN